MQTDNDVCQSCGRGAGCNCYSLPSHCRECGDELGAFSKMRSYEDDDLCRECELTQTVFTVKVGNEVILMSLSGAVADCWSEVLGCFDAFQGDPDLFSEPAMRFYGYSPE